MWLLVLSHAFAASLCCCARFRPAPLLVIEELTRRQPVPNPHPNVYAVELALRFALRSVKLGTGGRVLRFLDRGSPRDVLKDKREDQNSPQGKNPVSLLGNTPRRTRVEFSRLECMRVSKFSM